MYGGLTAGHITSNNVTNCSEKLNYLIPISDYDF